jgi:peptidoglycan/xylan/chitin deacetylase (PgdA/CDA1 family)
VRKTTRTAAAVVEWMARPIDATRVRPLSDLLILGYHRIDDAGSELSVRTDHFRAHLEWIETSGLRVVGLDDDDLLHPSHVPRVAFTFDDGYLSVAEHAWPALASHGFPATIYAVPGYLDDQQRFPWDRASDGAAARLMDTSVLRRLADDGMTVGSHTVTHRYLPGLALDEAAREIRQSKEMLEDLLERGVTSFSYPMGGWNRALRSVVAAAGYRTAVTVLRGRNRPGRDPLVLRRPIAESDPDDFARIVKGYFDFLRPLDWWRERARQRRVTVSHGSSAPHPGP